MVKPNRCVPTNRMQEWLVRATDELGIHVEIGYTVTLSDGRMLRSQALLPDLGNPLGMLVFCDAVDGNAGRDLVSQGYGYTSFMEPSPDESFDIDNYAEMFAEWGWASKEENKPRWMVKRPD